MAGFRERLAHAWNAFVFSANKPDAVQNEMGVSSGASSFGYRLDRTPRRSFNDRTIIGAIYGRMAIDAASVEVRHVRLDDNEQYLSDVDSALNNCLRVEANVDQGARQFRQDIAMTLFEYGVAAIVPVDTTLNPLVTGGYDVNTLRVAQVLQWYPRHVRVRVYDDNPENGGIRKDVLLPKEMVAIVENPLYSVMNEPNSVLQRLIRKLALLDDVDEQSASGKLDLIIQLPYVIKTETRRDEAQKRMKEIEFQLKGSQYGIAYTDGTEKITQLNRPAENNLMGQVQYLVTLLYSQLGITEEVMNGTAGEPVMINYFNRTIEPILEAITEAMHRTFLTKTARSQGQAIKFFRNPFKFVTIADLAQVADAFSRNEILSPNDLRGVIGFKPSGDPNANKLMNRNMPSPVSAGTQPAESPDQSDVQPDDGSSTGTDASSIMNSAFDQISSSLDDAISSVS
jgi:hypothetical protein